VEIRQRIVAMVLSGEIASKEDLQRAKINLCRELKVDAVPSNSELLEIVSEEDFPAVERILVRKPVRTLSGVAVVAVMTSPAPCPHGKCTYCPGGVENNSPQSYTGKEPAARRASFNEYDPFRQTSARMEQLGAIGHGTGKIDLIIMGGTFTSRPAEYQEEFVRRCFDAMNGKVAETLEEAHLWNEAAPHRCIGMTIETRPDSFDQAMADHVLALGCTRVEFGVQLLDDDILASVNRGHGVAEVTAATKIAKQAGLKVCYHIMPGLPGSSPEKDLESFRLMFEDERFRPDMLKIYPTLVVKGTKLYESWVEGAYVPYRTGEAAVLVADMKALMPRYARIQRIQRDIPVDLIEDGVDKSHLRELAREILAKDGRRCQCIRCREVGLMGIRHFEREAVSREVIAYRSSGGVEYFISDNLADKDGLVGYVRLRIDGNTARIRELKVFGQMAALGHKGEAQHRGFGKALLEEAERTARSWGCAQCVVTSGVGVRAYYEAQGYRRQGPYMAKVLGAQE